MLNWNPSTLADRSKRTKRNETKDTVELGQLLYEVLYPMLDAEAHNNRVEDA